MTLILILLSTLGPAAVLAQNLVILQAFQREMGVALLFQLLMMCYLLVMSLHRASPPIRGLAVDLAQNLVIRQLFLRETVMASLFWSYK